MGCLHEAVIAMERPEFFIPSADGRHMLHCLRWSPTGEPWAILQIVHGMCEHIARYDDFAR